MRTWQVLQVLSEVGPALLTLGDLYFWTLATPWASKLPANWNLATGPSKAEGGVVASHGKVLLNLVVIYPQLMNHHDWVVTGF